MPADSDSNYQLIKACSSHSRLGHGVPLKAQNHRALEDDVCCILQHYTPINNCDPAESNPSHNQICGAWVEALPCLLTTRQNNAFLSSAIKAFATSLRCFNSTDTAYKMHALEMYCKSLSLTSEALKQTQGVFKIQHCVAIMCLAVSDVSIFLLAAHYYEIMLMPKRLCFPIPILAGQHIQRELQIGSKVWDRNHLATVFCAHSLLVSDRCW